MIFLMFLLMSCRRPLELGMEVRRHFKFISDNKEDDSKILRSFTFKFPQCKDFLLDLSVDSCKLISSEKTQSNYIQGFIPAATFRRFLDKTKYNFVILMKRFANIDAGGEEVSSFIYKFDQENTTKVKFVSGLRSNLEMCLLSVLRAFTRILVSEFTLDKFRDLCNEMEKIKKGVLSFTYTECMGISKFLKDEVFQSLIFEKQDEGALKNHFVSHIRSNPYTDTGNAVNTEEAILLRSLTFLFNVSNFLKFFLEGKFKLVTFPFDVEIFNRRHSFTIEECLTFFVVTPIKIQTVCIEYYDSNYEPICVNIKSRMFRNYILIPYYELKKSMAKYVRVIINNEYISKFQPTV